MGLGWYGRWMTRWETRLTTRDTNRIVRPLEWGFDWLEDFDRDDGREGQIRRDAIGRDPISPNLIGRDFNPGTTGAQNSPGFSPREMLSDRGQSHISGAKAQAVDMAEMPGLKSRPILEPHFDRGTASLATGDSAREGDASGVEAILDGHTEGNAKRDNLARMIALNEEIVRRSEDFFAYTTPTDFRLETRHPQLFPTNVRPETLAQDAEMRRAAAEGELPEAEFLRFTSPVRTPHPENDQVNARWYPAADATRKPGTPKQAIIVMPQWNSDAISHNSLCRIYNRFGVSALRLSKPYHDIRRPAELERSDYAMSANVGRTISACRQAVADIRSCMDWLETQGYTQFGVMGTSLGSCYGFIAAAHDPRLRVCAFNHASTWFGDVVWEGQSTRHVRAGFEQAGLTQAQVRELFRAISPMAYMDRFAANPKESLVVYGLYDLTFPLHLSLDVLRNFRARGVDFTSRVLPCGHYTTGETPFKYLDGWYLGSFVRGAFRRLAAASRREARSSTIAQ